MEDDTLANAITYILLLRVKSFPKMYVTLCPPKWYHLPPLAHALIWFLVMNKNVVLGIYAPPPAPQFAVFACYVVWIKVSCHKYVVSFIYVTPHPPPRPSPEELFQMLYTVAFGKNVLASLGFC